jgi:hypothetical protein
MTTTRRHFLSGLVAAGVLFLGGFAPAAEPVTHRFFVCGWNSGGPAIYDAALQKTWSLNVPDEPSDGWVLPGGDVVYSFSKRKEKLAGVIRLGKNKNELWKYTSPNGSDNHSCQPLPHGGFLLGECGNTAVWMVEIDADGKEFKRVKVADAPTDIHHTFRMVRKTPQNTYLGTLMKPVKCGDITLQAGHAYEWDETGKLIHTFPSGSFLAVRLPNGNTLVSDGSGREGHDTVMTEYAPDDTVVWELSGQDLEKAGLCVWMVCGFHRLSNGNTVVSNVKHGKHSLGLADGDAPKVFEITPDKKLVSKVPAETSSGNMGGIQVLDDPGDPFKFEVFR